MAMIVAGYDYDVQPKVDVPQCPLCARVNTPLAMKDRYGFDVGYCICRCGYRYLNPRLTPEGYAEFYQRWYRPLAEAFRGSPMSMEDLEVIQTCYGQALAKACHEVPKEGWLLDAGGSTGAVVAGWRNDGTHDYTVVVDPSQDELAVAARRGYMTSWGTLEELQMSPVFEVIICAQTIDHCYDPLLALRNLRACVQPEGWLVIDYVNVEEVQANHEGRVKMKRLIPKIDHPCAWTKTSMELALMMTGWTPLRHITGTRRKGLFVCRAAWGYHKGGYATPASEGSH